MIPVVCFVGAKNVGKTTVLEKLIPELGRKGYRVGTVKHDVHGFEIDKEGKDTWRHSKAGARAVCISSPDKLAIIRFLEREKALGEIVMRYFWSEDIVLAEGFKSTHYPKIEVFRKEISASLVCGDPVKHNVIAVVGDAPDLSEVNHFGWDDIASLAEFIEGRYLKHRKKKSVSITVDGKQLVMNDFVRQIVGETIEGLLKTLKGWENPEHILIAMKRDKKTD